MTLRSWLPLLWSFRGRCHLIAPIFAWLFMRSVGERFPIIRDLNSHLGTRSSKSLFRWSFSFLFLFTCRRKRPPPCHCSSPTVTILPSDPTLALSSRCRPWDMMLYSWYCVRRWQWTLNELVMLCISTCSRPWYLRCRQKCQQENTFEASRHFAGDS